MQFLKQWLPSALGCMACFAFVFIFVCFIVDVASSIVRAADALERIADALECDEEDKEDKEDDKEKGGGK